MPWLTVRCATDGCVVRGQARRVLVALAAPDVAVLPRLACTRCWTIMSVGGDGMALAECERCTTLYAPDLPVCPHCGGDRAHEQGAPAVVPDVPVQAPEPPPDAPARPARRTRAKANT